MTAQANSPIRVLVIQLGHLGDTLQSLMALRAAKQLYPQLEITLVARQSFASAAKKVPWIKTVVELPVRTLVETSINPAGGDAEAMRQIARWVIPLVQERWDIVFNWTYSEASSYLAALVPARVRFGYSRTPDMQLRCIDGWSQYIQGVVQSGAPQNIHLTDILTTQILTALQIHVGEPASEQSPDVPKSFFSLQFAPQTYRGQNLDHSSQWIAIQLGSDSQANTISPKTWAQFAKELLQENRSYKIVLLGDEDQISAYRQFVVEFAQPEVFESRVLSMVGQTSFDLWASVIGQCTWLCSGDSAAIHLASILGTRVLHVATAGSRWWETGPYGNGHYVVTPADDTIEARSIYQIWSYANLPKIATQTMNLDRYLKSIESVEDKTVETSVRSSASFPLHVFRSRIRSTDEGGGVQYESITEHRQSEKEWLSLAVGHIARSWYCGWTPKLGREISRVTLSPALLQSLRKLDESASVLVRIIRESRQASTALAFKSGRLKSDRVMSVQKRDDLQELAKKLVELENLADRLIEAEPLLACFTNLSKVLMHNLDGDHLGVIAKQSAAAYRQLEEGLSILSEWVQYTLRLAKPVPLTNVKPIREEKPL